MCIDHLTECLFHFNTATLISQYLPLTVMFFQKKFAEYENCVTVAGPSTGMKCMLPFKFDEFTFNACPSDPSPTGKPWCSTKVDDNGEHVYGGPHWGECSSDCPTENERTMSISYNETGMFISAISFHNLH